MRVLKKKLWPYKKSMSLENDKEVINWLTTNIGQSQWYLVKNYLNTDFYFRKERDLIHFTLVWS